MKAVAMTPGMVLEDVVEPMPTEMAIPRKAKDIHAADSMRRGLRPTRSMMLMEVHVAVIKETALTVAMMREVSSGRLTERWRTRGR